MLKTTEKLVNISDYKLKLSKPKKKNFYGLELIVELFGCDLEIITSQAKIQEFINGVCREIKMEKYGSSYIKRFHGGGLWGEGYSFFQFITTSSVTGHFIENGGIAFINIFSCKKYDTEKAISFTEKFFRAKKTKSKLIIH